jgi:cation:H+ antiporter
MLIWLQLIACAAIILYAGKELSKYGDIIAEKTGLGRTWIGVVLMASITSLPELFTGISSVAIFNLPNLATGDIIGSCMFNILIIALLDVGYPLPLSTQAHQGNILSAGFGILLLALVIMAILGHASLPIIAWVSVSSILCLAIYLVAIRIIFLYERKRISELVEEIAKEFHYEQISQQKAFRAYLMNALIVIAAAIYLPHLGEEITQITGLAQTFVGTLFIAISTSLPEVVVSFAAIKLGAIDMAFGNLFGSNLFNIAILAIDDIFYTKGALISNISETHVLSATAAIAMTAIAVIGLTYRSIRKLTLISWDALGILGVYVAATLILYRMN